jgi:mono/diheme cytochrome c family protein
MTRVARFAAYAALLAAVGAAVSASAAAPNAKARISYTADQAWRGRLAFYQNCAECHGANLGGVTGPALAGPDGNLQWQTGKDIYGEISVAMPVGNGGGLPADEYVDIMAFLYQQHHKPAGKKPLDVRAIEADAAPMGL